jgi:transcriptional regulator with XRE-family HTH domain
MVGRAADAASLGHLVREQRARLRLTQSQLAERVGVSRSAISELEAGRIEQPRASVFARLATALGLPAAALLVAAGYPASDVMLELETDELAVLAASLARVAGSERAWLKTRLLELRDLLVMRGEATGRGVGGRRAANASAARTRGARRGRRAPRR